MVAVTKTKSIRSEDMIYWTWILKFLPGTVHDQEMVPHVKIWSGIFRDVIQTTGAHFDRSGSAALSTCKANNIVLQSAPRN